jgi:hypothetical protein
VTVAVMPAEEVMVLVGTPISVAKIRATRSGSRLREVRAPPTRLMTAASSL